MQKNKRKNKGKETKGTEIQVVTLWRLQYFCCILHTTLFYTVMQWIMLAVVFCSLSFIYLLFIFAATINICSWEKYNTVQF